MVRTYIFAITLIVFLCILSYFHPIQDFSEDLGLHITLGEIILKMGYVPKVNLLSYAFATFPFINNSWLSEVVFYFLYHFLGISGITIVVIAVFTGSILLLFHFAAKRTNVSISLLCLTFYLTIFEPRTVIRPEIFNCFFMTIFLLILYSNREKPTRWIFLLPLLELFWVNMHIYFIIGPALVGLFLVDAIFSNRQALSGNCQEKNQLKQNTSRLTVYAFPLLIVFLLTCLVTIFNPNFLHGALYPFTVFKNYGYTVEENLPLLAIATQKYWLPWFTSFFCAVGVFLILLIVYRKKISFSDWILIIVFTVLPLMAERTVTLFVFATFIPFTLLVFYGFETFESSFKRIPWKGIQYGICIIFVIFLLWSMQTTFGFGMKNASSFEGVANFFTSHYVHGPIFNDFDSGSYLDFAFYPKEKVFIDTRSEAYPASSYQDLYIPMLTNQHIFEKEAATYHFNSIILSYMDQTPWVEKFVFDIVRNPQWRLIYVDPYALLLVKNTEQNQQLIKKFGIDEKSITLSGFNSETDYIHAGFFFSETGWHEGEINALQTVLTKNPQNCFAMGRLSFLYAKKPTLAAIYSQRYKETCQ